jgi:hypothetical protein
MTAAAGHVQIAPIRNPGKSHDAAIFVSAGLLAIALVIILGAKTFPGSPEPINSDLVIAYP